MKYYLLLLTILGFTSLHAQTPTTTTPAATVVAPIVPDNRKLSLDERFSNMKAKAESYQDYKVIKSSTLDGEWKIFMDSLKANKAIWQETKRSMAGQQLEVKTAQDALKEKEASMADIIYGSTHFSFLGVSFSKGTFGVLFVIIVIGLALLAGLLAAKLKIMDGAIREKSDLAEVTMREYEEYKHKALDKQTKLSRELQNERNKLAEMRHN